jgi:hypothetical protein
MEFQELEALPNSSLGTKGGAGLCSRSKVRGLSRLAESAKLALLLD